MRNETTCLIAVIIAMTLASCVVPGGGGREEASYLIRVSKVAGVCEGPAEIWSAPGSRLATGRFRAGEPVGTWTFWDSRGTKIVMMEYLNGRQSGPLEMCYGSFAIPTSVGKLKLRGHLENGRLEGGVTTYSPEGKTIIKGHYKHGVLVSCQAVNAQGHPLSDAQARALAEDQAKADVAYLGTIDEIIRNSALYAKPIP